MFTILNENISDEVGVDWVGGAGGWHNNVEQVNLIDTVNSCKNVKFSQISQIYSISFASH